MRFWSISSDDLRNALIFGTTTACFAQTCMSKCQRRVPRDSVLEVPAREGIPIVKPAPTTVTGPLGSTVHVLRADAETVAALAAIDWSRRFRRVCVDPARGLITFRPRHGPRFRAGRAKAPTTHNRGRQRLPTSSKPARSGVSDQTWSAVFSSGGGEDPETVPQPQVAPCTKDGFPPAGRIPSCLLRECRHWPVSRCMISRTLFSGRTTSNGKQNSVSPWPATLSLNSYRRGESNVRVRGYISATEPQPNFLP